MGTNALVVPLKKKKKNLILVASGQPVVHLVGLCMHSTCLGLYGLILLYNSLGIFGIFIGVLRALLQLYFVRPPVWTRHYQWGNVYVPCVIVVNYGLILVIQHLRFGQIC